MASIKVESDAADLAQCHVAIVEAGDAWMLACSEADSSGECLNDLAAGDTWSSLEPAVQDAMTHIRRHQRAASDSPCRLTYAHTKHVCGHPACRES